MIQDNARYTAMRLFQDIEGSEVIYINTYAATAPRLNVFRGICSSTKDNGEDFIESDATTIAATTASGKADAKADEESNDCSSQMAIEKIEVTVPAFSRD